MGISKTITIRLNSIELEKLESLIDPSKKISPEIKKLIFSDSLRNIDSEESLTLLRAMTNSLNTLHTSVLNSQNDISYLGERLGKIESYLESLSED